MTSGLYLVSAKTYELTILPNDYRINWDYILVTARGVLIHIISSAIEFPFIEKRD